MSCLLVPPHSTCSGDSLCVSAVERTLAMNPSVLPSAQWPTLGLRSRLAERKNSNRNLFGVFTQDKLYYRDFIGDFFSTIRIFPWSRNLNQKASSFLFCNKQFSWLSRTFVCTTKPPFPLESPPLPYMHNTYTRTHSLTPHTPSISPALTMSKIVHLLRILQKLASFPY